MRMVSDFKVAFSIDEESMIRQEVVNQSIADIRSRQIACISHMLDLKRQ